MSKQVSRFWWRWLVVVVVGVIVFSMSLVLLPETMQDLFNRLYFGISSDGTPYGAQATHVINFVYGVLGALMAGWMALVLSIVLRAFRRGEREAWDSIALSLVVWFVVDTAFSLSIGIPQNALFNTLFLVLFAIPLGATYRHFHHP